MSPTRLAILTIGLTCLGFAAWTAISHFRERPSAVVAPVSETDVHDRSAATPIDLEQSDALLPPAAQVSASRQPAAAARFEGSVTDADGSPIRGATVSWTPRSAALLRTWAGWDRQDWSALQASSKTTQTDEQGHFEFSESISSEDAPSSVIWVTHPNYLAVSIEVSVEEQTWLRARGIRLEPGRAMSVSVVDGSGSPITGVELEQMVWVPSGADADSFQLQDERLLYRRQVVDGETVRVPTFGAERRFVLRARKNDWLSVPWIGTERDHLTLTLQPTFEAGGSLTLDPATTLDGAPHVQVFAQRGSMNWLIASIETDSTATWGPCVLPIVEADAYRFRIQGYNVQIREELRPSPRPGEKVRVDFTMRAGNLLWFRAIDTDGQLIPDAQAEVHWTVNGRRMSATAGMGPHGAIGVAGLPEAVVSSLVRAPGHVCAPVLPIRLPENPVIGHEVTLARAGSLHGRVTFRGQPVKDFEITFLPGENSAQAEHREFHAREDGSFEIDDAPIGLTSVLASSADHPRSIAQHVVVPEEGVAQVSLELPESLRARGRVVCRDTSKPPKDAWIQIHLDDDFTVIGPWGLPQAVNDDGTFEVAGLAPGRCTVQVGAPGYSAEWLDAIGIEGQVCDLGLVTLDGLGSLRVAIRGPEGFDPTGYLFAAAPPMSLPESRFSQDGTVVFDGIEMGPYRSTVFDDSGRVTVRATFLVEDTKGAALTFHVDGTPRLRVIVPESMRGAPNATVSLRCAAPGTVEMSREQPLSSNEFVLFGGLPVGPFEATLHTGDVRRPIGTATGDIPSDTTESVVTLEPAIERALQVIDKRRQGVPDVLVRIYRDEANPAMLFARTDANGVCTIAGLRAGEALADLSHTTLGTSSSIPVRIRASTDSPTVLTLDSDATLAVQVVDGTDPLAGVYVQLFDVTGRLPMPNQSTDANGVTKWTGYGGRYHVRLSRADAWPAEASVTAREDGEPIRVAMRRTGELELVVRNPDGSGAAGQEIALECLDLGERVADWIAAGKLAGVPGGLVTDGSGKLNVRGIPQGQYRWTVASSAGPALHGTVEVRAGQAAFAQIILP